MYRSGASISEAYAPIRKLRERAGAEIILPANNEELETAIFNEWMLELSFENWHEWFAMIRFAGYTEKPDFTRLLALNKTLREALEKNMKIGSTRRQLLPTHHRPPYRCHSVVRNQF